MGLRTIWRLPGGGFAVGRFSGPRGRIGERELPVLPKIYVSNVQFFIVDLKKKNWCFCLYNVGGDSGEREEEGDVGT